MRSRGSLSNGRALLAGILLVVAGPSMAVGQEPPAASAGEPSASAAPATQSPAPPAAQPPASPVTPGAVPSTFGRTEAPFDIWDVKIGSPVSTIPDAEIVNVACGTNGGPPSTFLKNFSEFAKCPAEPSGLHEVHFEYDDEQTYIAKAYNMEDRYLQAGTTVYAHPVNVSVLVDDGGIARGIRIVTDDRASVRDRRQAASLEVNLRGRFSGWNLDCKKIAPADGEQSVGNTFVNDVCMGKDPASDQSVAFQSRYFRRKGQTALDPITQKVVKENFLSDTRFELVQAPFTPAIGGDQG